MTTCPKCREETEDYLLIGGVCIVCFVMNPSVVPIIRFGRRREGAA